MDHGWAVFQVPIFPEPTFEDPSVSDPKERLLLFGQTDHVRKCGLDYANRMAEVGFKVDTFSALDLVANEHELVRLGISEGQTIFFCQKSDKEE